MSKPEPEPEPTSRPEAEPEVHTVEPSSEAESSAEPESIGEPFPEWSTAVMKWGFAWDFYQYGFGAVFAVIGLLSLAYTVRLKRTQGFRQKKAHIANLTLLAVFGISRALSLCFDAYHSKRALPRVLVNVLWGVGQPCIVTAYTLVFVVLRNALMLKQRFQSWYTTRNIALTTLPYFCIVFIAEITISFVPTFKGLTFTCQLLYVLSSLALLIFYAFIAVILWKKIRKVSTGVAWNRGSGSRMRSIFITCCCAMVGGALLCGTNLYGIAGVYGVFSTAHHVPPWPWLAFNMTQRFLEISMCVLLFCILARKGVTSTANTEVTATKAPGNSSVVDSERVAKARQKTRKEAELTLTEVSDA